MRRMLFVLLGATITVAVCPRNINGQGQPQAPEPAEVRKTVQAIVGAWEGQMTAKVPGEDPETFVWLVDCKPVALGAGAACTNGGKASIGLISETCLAAYDPVGRAVHYMCVTSMGEVHDHKGQWRDDKTVEFEPLHAGMVGKPVTEIIKWSFPDPKTLIKTSVVELPDGTSMRFEFMGKRKK